ncbi:hypothetical protein ENSA5_30340 [Enhygromyxa salina]|uniref:Uncharacterized protein n=1 Tax=Enhygromyxa salina TaxID=215803 RepID=A0A2S9XZX3_9BACT|nr:hypothetical protein [Enhygromyxa salina]PRP98301.1 hypothetical protein ENSA5_30340 [Enhygromyxa salina]
MNHTLNLQTFRPRAFLTLAVGSLILLASSTADARACGSLAEDWIGVDGDLLFEGTNDTDPNGSSMSVEFDDDQATVTTMAPGFYGGWASPGQLVLSNTTYDFESSTTSLSWESASQGYFYELSNPVCAPGTTTVESADLIVGRDWGGGVVEYYSTGTVTAQ